MMSGPRTYPLLEETPLSDWKSVAGLSARRPARPPLRLKLKSRAQSSGHVDGGWWPRSRDLRAELPPLAKVLAVRLSSVRRVEFARASWKAAPASIDVGGHTVRLEGSDMQDENLLHVIGRDGRRVILVVVPPEASDAAGHSAIVAAGRRGYPETPTEILTTCGVLGRTAGTSESRGVRDDGQERWEADGGYADMPLLSDVAGDDVVDAVVGHDFARARASSANQAAARGTNSAQVVPCSSDKISAHPARE
jgi:Family of unknown function (DUF5994)